MASEGEWRHSNSHEWLNDLDQVKHELLLMLPDYDVSDQLIDMTPDAEHQRCVNYIKSKYTEVGQELREQADWPELSANGRGDANTALVVANVYRLEKEFQTSLVEDATTTRRIVDRISEQFERGEEIDQNFAWTTAFNKKQLQILFDIYYGKPLSDPWQQFYHAATEQLPSVNYTNPDDVVAFIIARDSYWHFEDICAAHNMILREAAEETGLFRVQDDVDSVMRLVTILVETQLIAIRDREQGTMSTGIREYGEKYGVGSKLITILENLYMKRYFQD